MLRKSNRLLSAMRWRSELDLGTPGIGMVLFGQCRVLKRSTQASRDAWVYYASGYAFSGIELGLHGFGGD
jgi:hypothetical protein